MKVKLRSLSCVRLFATSWTAAHQAPPSVGLCRQEYWSGLPFLSPMHESEVTQSFPNLSNPMDCSPPGSSIRGIFQAKLLEWVVISFSRGSECQTRDQTQVSCIGRHSLYHWATWEALLKDQNTHLSFSMNFIKSVNGMLLKQVLTSLFRIITCTGHSKLALSLNTEEISLFIS